MPRIIICCNSFPPEKGGAPNRIYNLAVLLRGLGYKVTVITAMPNYPTGAVFPGYRGRLVYKEQIEGIEVIRLWLIPSNSGSLRWRGISLLSFLASFLLLAAPRLLFRRSAGVIVSSPPLINAWLAAAVTRLAGKKLIVNISDIWPLTVKEMGALKEGALLGLLQRTERYLYRAADAFTGQSQEILDHIRETVPHDKPAFLYRNLQDAAVAAMPVDTAVRIVYAGNLGHAQGMADLCRSVRFRELGVQLDIYGDGAERAAIDAFISEQPDCGIRLLPTLPMSELGRRLGAYNAVLIPLRTNIHGAVPSKLFMAVAYGLPVVFCGGGEGAALVHAHGLGPVCGPGDYAGLSEHLARLSGWQAGQWAECRRAVAIAAETVFSKKVQDKAFADFVARVFGAAEK